MHNPKIQAAASAYLKSVDTRPGEPWRPGEVERHLVGFAEQYLRERECPYCDDSGVIEAECYPGGSFEDVLCPCGAQPADTADDETEDDDDLVDDPPPNVAP